MMHIAAVVIFIIAFLERSFFTAQLKEPAGKVLDKILTKITIFTYLLVSVISVIDFFINNNFLFAFNYIAGVSFIAIGSFLRRWTILVLGNNWSIFTKDINGQKLIKTGPYRYFDNPYHLSVVLELSGVCFLFNSLYGFAFLFLVHTPLVIMRILKEKQLHKIKFAANVR